AIRGDHDRVAGVAQDVTQRVSYGGVVFDDEDAGAVCHAHRHLVGQPPCQTHPRGETTQERASSSSAGSSARAPARSTWRASASRPSVATRKAREISVASM